MLKKPNKQSLEMIVKYKKMITVIFVLFLAILFYWFFFMVPVAAYFSSININGREIKVEVAQDTVSRARGLSGRESMSSDQGMLFKFQDSSYRTFWMFRMKFDLDIIFMSDDTVANVITLKAPKSRFTKPEAGSSSKPVNYVLELNAGMAEKLGVVEGSRIVVGD